MRVDPTHLARTPRDLGKLVLNERFGRRVGAVESDGRDPAGSDDSFPGAWDPQSKLEAVPNRYAALEAAAQRPEVARSLVLLGTAAAMPVHPALQSAADAGDPLAGRLITSWGIGSRAHTGGHASPGMWLIGGNTSLLDRARPGVLANDLAACDAYDGAEQAAARVQCPVTLVLGRQDKMTPNKRAAPMIAAFGDVRSVYLDRVGHFLQIESPIPVREAIAAALAGRPSERLRSHGHGPERGRGPSGRRT